MWKRRLFAGFMARGSASCVDFAASQPRLSVTFGNRGRGVIFGAQPGKRLAVRSIKKGVLTFCFYNIALEMERTYQVSNGKIEEEAGRKERRRLTRRCSMIQTDFVLYEKVMTKKTRRQG